MVDLLSNIDMNDISVAEQLKVDEVASVGFRETEGLESSAKARGMMSG